MLMFTLRPRLATRESRVMYKYNVLVLLIYMKCTRTNIRTVQYSTCTDICILGVARVSLKSWARVSRAHPHLWNVRLSCSSCSQGCLALTLVFALWVRVSQHAYHSPLAIDLSHSLQLPLTSAAHCLNFNLPYLMCSCRSRCSRSSSALCNCSQWRGIASRTSRSHGALLRTHPLTRTVVLTRPARSPSFRSTRTHSAYSICLLLLVLTLLNERSFHPHCSVRPSRALSKAWSPKRTPQVRRYLLIPSIASHHRTQSNIHLMVSTVQHTHCVCLIICQHLIRLPIPVNLFLTLNTTSDYACQKQIILALLIQRHVFDHTSM